jgi:DNA-binding MarR family transcriptional regulator
MEMSEPRWLTPEEREAWIALMVMTMKLNSAMDAQLQRDSGLTVFEYQVVAALSESVDRRAHMSDLAVMVSASQSRLSNVVKRLEQRGWIQRAACPGNARYTNAILTDEGYAVVVAAAPGHVEEVRRRVFDVLGPERVTALYEVCRDIVHGIDPAAPLTPQVSGAA